MKIGFIGLGKLGLPCAVSMATKHDVMGYDINPDNMSKDPKPYQECGMKHDEQFNDYLAKSSIKFGSMAEVAEHSDIIFVAVQTPHDPKFEGVTPIPEERKDFDYKYLISAIEELSDHVKKSTVVVVISTVLPGTMEREIRPRLNEYMELVYNPYFIAMGTTMYDFFNPDLILIGSDKDCDAAEKVSQIYISLFQDRVDAAMKMVEEKAKELASLISTGGDRKKVFDLLVEIEALQRETKINIQEMSVESAELSKVSYNTFISLKIAFANIIGEMCNKIPGAHVDEVTDALKSASKRITGPMYLSAGMGDAGGCHPRDNIALSWWAKENNLSYDIFEAAMMAREKHAELLANTMCMYEMPPSILGYAYKPNINLTVGSHALLVKHFIEEKRGGVYMLDDWVDKKELHDEPACILVGINHDYIKDVKFPEGSLVIDPFRMIEDQEGVRIVRIGE